MKLAKRVTLAVGSSVLLASAALGQALNIDCGGVLGEPPSDEYGAGAGQLGFWNPTSNVATGMLDIHGMVTAASFTCDGSVGLFDMTGASEDDERMMESTVVVDQSQVTAVRNLVAGRYQVYVYSWFPLTAGSRTVLISAFNGDGSTQVSETITFGGVWPGGQVEGETFASFTIDAVNGRNFIAFTAQGGVGEFPLNRINGIQVVPIPAPGSAALCLALGTLALRSRR